jgi:Superinfection immunity protein
MQRHTNNRNSVLVINLFLGWSFLGWVVALAMAVSGANERR